MSTIAGRPALADPKSLLKTILLVATVAAGFAFQADAQAGGEISEKKLKELLSSTHEVPWATHARTDDDLEAIRQGLEQLIDRRERGEWTRGEAERISQRAIAEYGKFAVSQDGALHPDSKRLLASLQQRAVSEGDDSPLRVAVIRALANANTPEAMRMLSELIQSGSPVTSHSALAAMEQMLKEETDALPERPSDMIPPFQPQAGAPYRKSGKAEEWEKAIREAAERIRGAFPSLAQAPASVSSRLRQTLARMDTYLETRPSASSAANRSDASAAPRLRDAQTAGSPDHAVERAPAEAGVGSSSSTSAGAATIWVLAGLVLSLVLAWAWRAKPLTRR